MVMIRGRRGTRTHQGAPPTTGHLIQRTHRLGRALLTPGPLYHMVTLRLTKAQVKKQKKKPEIASGTMVVLLLEV